MKRVLIISISYFFSLLFSHIQTTSSTHHFIRETILTFTWPGFLSVCCDYIARITLIGVIVDQEVEKIKEVRWTAWIIYLSFVDFLFEGNFGWFNINLFGYLYAVSFDTVAGLGYGLIAAKCIIQYFNEK